MKRKTKTGLKLITQLIDRMPKETTGTANGANSENDAESIGTSSDFIQNLMYIYRAYANFVLEDYEASLKDYLKAN